MSKTLRVVSSVATAAVFFAFWNSCGPGQKNSKIFDGGDGSGGLLVNQSVNQPHCKKNRYDLAESPEWNLAYGQALESGQLLPAYSGHNKRVENLVTCFLGRSSNPQTGEADYWLNNARLVDLAAQLKDPTGNNVTHQWLPKSAGQDPSHQKPDLQAVEANPDAFIVNSIGPREDFRRILAAALLTAAEVEEPVTDRPGYGQESFFYFYPLSPSVARFTGGELEFSEENWLSKPKTATRKGVWENEEFGHGAHFKKAARVLFGQDVLLKPKQMRPLNYEEDQFKGQGPLGKIRSHAMMRVASEVGASSFYFWILAHTTKDLQRHVMFPFEDELGHMIKFYSIYRWAFPELGNMEALADIAKGLITQVSRNNQEGAEAASGAAQEEADQGGTVSGGRSMLRKKTWAGLVSQLELVGITTSVITKHLNSWASQQGTKTLLEETLGRGLADSEPVTVKIRQLPFETKVKIYSEALTKLESEYPYASPRSDVPSHKKAHNPIAFRKYIEELLGQVDLSSL